MQVQNNQTNLLKHPLITSLLDLKWRTYGRLTYFSNLLIYAIFVTSITTFSLLSLNPQSDTCKSIMPVYGIDCYVVVVVVFC